MVDERGLLSGRRLTRNAAWSVVGAGAPLLVALVAVPVLVRELGSERFGLLALVWVAIGYFSLFDLGVGRALTRLVSERLGEGRLSELPDVVRTGLVLMGGLGLLAGATFAVATPGAVRSVLNVPVALETDAQVALWVLSAALPFVIVTAALVGLLEAYQQFRPVNIIRLILGALTYLAPLLALQFWDSLTAATAGLALARILGMLAYLVQCRRLVAPLRASGRFRGALVRPLLSFGAWLTVSNLLSPLMAYLDRFVIGATVTLTAVTLYTIPYDVVTRLWVFPIALGSVLFPAFAAGLSANSPRLANVFGGAAWVTALIMFPSCGVVILFASEGLGLWLGEEFRGDSATVLQILAVGVFANSMARLPWTLLQSAGRADTVAKLHLIEAPAYLGVLWMLLGAWGILGAGVAWTCRLLVDGAMLMWLAKRAVPHALSLAPWIASVLALGALIVGGVVSDSLPLITKAVTAIVVVMGCGALGVVLVKSMGRHERSALES